MDIWKMRESFEQQKKLLHVRYGALSMDDRRQILCKLRKRNILMYRQLERLKHELLRVDAKPVHF
ncbi:hypothetical protein ACPTE4_15520, partial [Enterococcus faecium]